MWTMCDHRIICITISVACLIAFFFIFSLTLMVKVYIQLVYVILAFIATLSLMYGASKGTRFYILAWIWIMIPAVLWGVVVSIKRIVEMSKIFVYDLVILTSAIAVVMCGIVVCSYAIQLKPIFNIEIT